MIILFRHRCLMMGSWFGNSKDLKPNESEMKLKKE